MKLVDDQIPRAGRLAGWSLLRHHRQIPQQQVAEIAGREVSHFRLIEVANDQPPLIQPLS